MGWCNRTVVVPFFFPPPERHSRRAIPALVNWPASVRGITAPTVHWYTSKVTLHGTKWTTREVGVEGSVAAEVLVAWGVQHLANRRIHKVSRPRATGQSAQHPLKK